MAETRIVTLDGPAGVGKTTLARRTAEALGLAYLDTGAMFRATAWKLGEGAWLLPEPELAQRLDSLAFSLRGTGADSRLYVNDAPVTDEVRTEQVGMWASNIATLPIVRNFQKAAQQAIGAAVSLVAEGRDMGTVVFPRAACKIFLDADPAERARRRYLQYKEMGREADLAELEASIRARDEQDRNRAVAPLRPAEDAVIIDTTGIDIEQVFERILAAVESRA